MSDIIRLLPDSVANQIAAGEVIQRPASVVKELVENAIDAGSTNIKINIKDAGKTLIQVIDNGCGMSETDARMAFERHSTSKIKTANDLFAIQTMGFRGEALASVAAIANVELKSKRLEDELGTFINIQASKVITQDAIQCSDGCNFLVKNLFFNVPARRKFLKANSTELRYIIEEVQRLALSHPDISFLLYHNKGEIYNLPITNHHQRIINIFGKKINKGLIPLNTKTSIVEVKGFIGKPEFARRTGGEQFFFVNNRYMRHPYFYKAVIKTYEKMIHPHTFPSFFIYFIISPDKIDINIHPTKTEIKFEDEQAIWQILQASIKQTFGKFNIVSSLDFNRESIVDINITSKNADIKQPVIPVNPDFNPFDEEKKSYSQKKDFNLRKGKENIANWEKLYSDFENPEPPSKTPSQPEGAQAIQAVYFHLKNKYILTPVKSGLMIIDQKRAHERILFEKYLSSLNNNTQIAQKTLFPKKIELNAPDFSLLKEIINDIRILGFDISEFGKNTFVVNGMPADINESDTKDIIDNLLENYKDHKDTKGIKIEARENIAISLAKASAINYGKSLTNEEMRDIIDNLFACETPDYSPDGKAIINILNIEELEKRF